MKCRVCGHDLGKPALVFPSPAITSISSSLDIPTDVYICSACRHVQLPDLPDLKAFYDTSYRIWLTTEDHDIVVAVENGQPVFRTDRQVAIAKRMLSFPEGARVLDYGAGKANTLRQVHADRSDIVPYVFDVSSDYCNSHWDKFVESENQATHTLPTEWAGTFDAVMSSFVLEHVADPVGFLTTLRDQLAPGGKMLISVPDTLANPGDIVVVDHLNHFTVESLETTFQRAGLTVEEIDRTSFPGAFFVLASAGDVRTELDQSIRVDDLYELCESWKIAAEAVDAAASRHKGRKVAVYGAGFYGTWIAVRIRDLVDISAFFDQNPMLQGSEHLGIPVLPPSEMPSLEFEALFVGLNPTRARSIIADIPAAKDLKAERIWLG